MTPCGARARASRAPCRASASGRTSTGSRATSGLGGWVRNDERGVVVEVEGEPDAVERFLARLAARGAAARGASSACAAATLGCRGERELRDRRERAPRCGRRAGRRRHGDLRRLPGRAVRPGRPPLPLPVRQLHQLRAALHDRARRPLRPAAHDDGRLRDVRRLPGGVRRPARPPLPRRSRTRARRAGRARGWSTRTARPARAAARRRGRRRGRGAARRRDRRGQGHRRLPPRVPRRRRARRRGAARAQAPRGQAVRADGRATSTRRARSSTLDAADEAALLAGRDRPIVLAPRRPGARVAAAVAPGAAPSSA